MEQKHCSLATKKKEKTMKKNYSWSRRKGRGEEGYHEKGEGRRAPKNHMDGGGKPHKEVVCFLYLERRRSFSR